MSDIYGDIPFTSIPKLIKVQKSPFLRHKPYITPRTAIIITQKKKNLWIMDIKDYLKNKNVLFLFPHPDDESYSCFTLICHLLSQKANIFLQFLTTGAPSLQNYGPPQSHIYSYNEYVTIRHKEFLEAMNFLGLSSRYNVFNYHSREVSTHLDQIVQYIMQSIRRQKYSVIFCPPYEGAHPDHDLTNFITNLLVKKAPSLTAIEYTDYHLKNGTIETGKFFSQRTSEFKPIILTRTNKLRVKAYMNLYHSQLPVFKMFNLETERFRPKPIYNYSLPPSNEIYYESWPSNINYNMISDVIKRFL